MKFVSRSRLHYVGLDFISAVFGPHRMYLVRKMRPIATDVARSVICVSVCPIVCRSQGCTV